MNIYVKNDLCASEQVLVYVIQNLPVLIQYCIKKPICKLIWLSCKKLTLSFRLSQINCLTEFPTSFCSMVLYFNFIMHEDYTYNDIYYWHILNLKLQRRNFFFSLKIIDNNLAILIIFADAIFMSQKRIFPIRSL